MNPFDRRRAAITPRLCHKSDNSHSKTRLLRYAKFLVVLCAAMFVACLAPHSAKAEYLLGSGDTLDISIFGRPDLNRRTTVDPDGNISLPLVGEVLASGLSLAAFRAKLKNLMATSDLVRGVDVIVDLVENRPFYIYGYVTNSGAYPYRPGMTVRHALALAGGFNAARSSISSITPLTSADLRGRYKLLMSELAKAEVRVASLRAEAANKTEIGQSVLSENSAPRNVVTELVDLAKQHLSSTDAERKKELQHLRRALEMADTELESLVRGQIQDQEAVRQQEDELNRIAELNRKGLASMARVSDEQRAAVLLKSREADTAARLSRARQAREELLRKIERVDDRQLRIPRELQDALVALEGIRTQIKAVSEQIIMSGNMGAQLTSSEVDGPNLTIFRKKDGAQIKISATADMEVQPGDVVEVKMNIDLLRSALGN
ncbi:polysaccharide biosynthesis/export family protein [Microvirga vignae]|nr:polysaccharide biosynthesis/export family protein [Microvirga vignae]